MQASNTTENPKLLYAFKASELPHLLEQIRQKHPYCEIRVECPSAHKVIQRVLIFQNGEVGYCGDRKPKLEDYVELVHHKINNDWIERIFEETPVEIQNQMSPRQFFQRLLKFRAIQKGDIIKLQLSSFLLALEPIFQREGKLAINILQQVDQFIPVQWRLINLALEKRLKSWVQFQDDNCTMDSVPLMTEEGIAQLRADQDSEPKHQAMVNFLEATIDNRSSLVELSQRHKTDPLSLAKKLTRASNQGWVHFSDASQSENVRSQPKILVVDENQVTRKLLVRLLQAYYEAHETSGTIEAVSLMPQKSFDAIIMSYSLSLESRFQLCRIIRQNPRFKHLPIFFISQTDNFFEKAKAKIAGVTEYLTNPLDQNKILKVLESHL